LNKGYRRFPDLFVSYLAAGQNTGGNPGLALGLDVLRDSSAEQIIRAAGHRPTCLIQGITCAHNPFALRRYLTGLGVEPTIQAIDIIDVEGVARSVGVPLTDVAFRVSDAANLADWAEGSVHILVQDHLLNCCPHAAHSAVLQEAARVLAPAGVLMLNFSVAPPDGRAALSQQQAEDAVQSRWSEEAYCLEDLAGSRLPEVEPLLLGKWIQLAGPRQVLVTRPHGNFEFYSSYEELEQLLARFGLRFAFVKSAPAQGVHGACLRYRTLVQHVPAR
jgi:SAM-dependent methyltransferase